MKAPLSCSVFLFRQLCTRGKSPAKRPRNAPLWGLNLSAQLSLVNLFLCEIFPKPFIPPLSSGSWNAGKKIHFFFLFSFFLFFRSSPLPPRMCLLCTERGWAEKKTCEPMHLHMQGYQSTMDVLGAALGWGGGIGLLRCQPMRVSITWALGPQPGSQPEKHLTGCFHGNITVSLEWKASVV